MGSKHLALFLAGLVCAGCVVDEAANADGGSSAVDVDGDGYGADRDCDDSDPAIHPGAAEICGDGIDQNCSGRDGDCATQDDDLDGYTVEGGDCDDTDPNLNPNMPEVCGDGIDQDCSGADLHCDDADQDRDNYSVNEGDCDDADPVRTPSRLETCDDGVDQDCDGRDLPCTEVDMDGDGYSRVDGDCDDGNPRVGPGVEERCGDGVDQDCDGVDPECADDQDMDGVPDVDDVCPDVPDGLQADRDGDGVGDMCDNCPRVVNADQADADADGNGDRCDDDVDRDGDGLTGPQGDCNDDDPLVYPGAAEACDGLDNDCNGFVDDDCPTDLRSMVVAFEAGPSLMGSQDADPVRCAGDPRSDENCDEVPQAQVQLSAFAIELHEVTNTQFKACIAAGRCSPPRRPENAASAGWFDDPAYADHPVVWVSQTQASMYCAFAGRRLPTEAQWERAARGDAPLEQRRYPWGNAAPVPCETTNLANCRENTARMGRFDGDITAQGVVDLGGNVKEVVAGLHDPIWYRRMPAVDPPALLEGDFSYIPVRGGSYRSAPAFSTITYRGFRELMGRREGRPDVGFRCVSVE